MYVHVCTHIHTHSRSTFVCPTEILAFSDRVEEFHAINTEVVACSVDSKYTHYAWINTPRDEGGLSGLKIPLLSDITKQISKDYGVLLEDMGFSLRSVPILYSQVRYLVPRPIPSISMLHAETLKSWAGLTDEAML